ncbi:hypothetical protein F4779DRAFT_631637 [Xylariaceae sp. FL0662B]|nr:hypothetical protein F4779DRAFT_631637 [Xylariaceae sp. FL0662B]
MMDSTAAKHLGVRLLGEVEEESLEELLSSLRANLTPSNRPTTITTATTNTPVIPISALQTLTTRHQKATQSALRPILSVSGRYLPLLYHLISILIAAPHSHAVVVIDVESRFDVTRLVSSPASPSSPSSSYPAQPTDLKHVHIYRPPHNGPSQIAALLASASAHMLYNPRHASRSREWWGTVVVGGVGGDVSSGWRGWLAVQREAVGGFAVGISVEEALAERARRQEVVDAAGWVAMSRWGGYVWKD